MAKVTKKESQDRTTYVIALMAAGVRPSRICENAAVESWGVSLSQVWRYITKAHRFFEDRAVVDRSQELGLILEQYDFIYENMIKAKDFRGAGLLLDRRAELIGLKKLNMGIEATEKIVTINFKSKEDAENL